MGYAGHPAEKYVFKVKNGSIKLKLPLRSKSKVKTPESYRMTSNLDIFAFTKSFSNVTQKTKEKNTKAVVSCL